MSKIPVYKPVDVNLNYDSMTISDLKDICKERGLTGYSNLNKNAIIELLKE
ncbi:MAG: Rho termination factor N-terminal domain-containing protein [Romboutsia sp.]